MNPFVNQVQLAWNWFSAPAQWQGVDGIPNRLLQHLEYSGIALLVAALIGVSLGMLIGHTGRGGFLVVSIANIARAIPTLGLLLLVVALTSLGLVPVLVPLIALAVPPILVNTYEGIRGVEAEIKDAARGMGMTGWGVLVKAEAPVAMPLILLGVRTAAIQIVATATIAAYASLGGLGRFIIDGINRGDYQTVVGGALLVVALALAIQLAFLALRRFVVSPGLVGSSRPSRP